jgi:hypothetical protein
MIRYFGGEKLEVEAPEDGWAWGTDKKGRRCRYWFEQLTEQPWGNVKHFKGPPPRPLTITIPELVDSYAEGTLCPAAADTIAALVRERQPPTPTPAIAMMQFLESLPLLWRHYRRRWKGRRWGS